MNKQAEKQALRETMRKLNEKLSNRYLSESSCAIQSHLLAMTEYQDAETIFCFVSGPREVDTFPVLTHVLEQGKTLCVPRCTEGTMELRQITAVDQLHPGSYGILEPSADAPEVSIDAVDFAILPCVTCNHAGQRLGHGGGYYDRFLSKYRGGTVLLCPERLIREEIPVEPSDYPIPWVLTEVGLYEDGTPARLS